jgi:hypothetical protein
MRRKGARVPEQTGSDRRSPDGDRERDVKRPASSTVRGHWREHKGEVLLIGIVTLLATAAVPFGVKLLSAASSPGNDPPSILSRAEDLGEYVRDQPYWSGPPSMFKDALADAFEDQDEPTHPVFVQLNAAGTDLEAHSVSYLAQNGAAVRSVVMVIVGRVRSVSSSAAQWAPQGKTEPGPNRDIVLESANHSNVIYGFVSGSPRAGAIVHFPGLVVAVGRTKEGASTAYVVGVGTATSRPPASGAIRDVMRHYDKPSG